MVWENVPGAFSSNKGEDFRAVLEETARVKDSNAVIPRPPNGKWADAGAIMGNGWSIAWRVLDAQFWGVPQRRRRIVLVADFDGECAGEILFKRDGLSRHIETSGEKGQGIAADAERRFGETIGFDAYQHHNWRESDKLGVLTTGVGRVRGDTPLVMEMTHADEVIRFHDKGVVPTLQSRMGTGGNQVPMVYDIQGSMIGRADENGPQGNGVNEDVMFTLNTTDRHGVVYGICSDASNSMKSSNPRSSIYEAETSRTLDANGGNPACNQGGMAVVGTFSLQRSDEYKQSDVACTQARRQYKDSTDLVIASVDCRNFNETEMHGTLQAKENGGQSLNYMGAVRTGYAVRRLIPTEYLRLQAFPDWWFDDLAIDNPTEDDLIFWQEVFDTHARINGNKPKSRKQIIKWLKNPYSDSAAYKACGNSVATVCMEYVMEGIREVLGRG
jgi:DNA (cytosine-5)-methyltransferase 1